MAPQSSTLVWKTPWTEEHGVAKSRIRLSDFTFTFHFHALEKGNDNPLQCSCLENPRDREAWWAAVYGVSQSRTWLKRLSSSSSSSSKCVGNLSTPLLLSYQHSILSYHHVFALNTDMPPSWSPHSHFSLPPVALFSSAKAILWKLWYNASDHATPLLKILQWFLSALRVK